MKQLVKGSAALTTVSIGELVMRFLRTKLIAIFLGTAGTGFLAQLMIFFELMRVWGDLGSRRGVIKQIAELRQEKRSEQRYREIVSTSYFLALAASGLTGLFVVLFSPQLSQSLFGDSSHAIYIIALGVLLPLASLSTVTASILKGNLEYQAFTKYTLVSYAAVMVLTPFMLYFFRYWGAVLVMAFFFIFPLCAYLFYNTRSKFIFLSKQINFASLGEQFSYGFVQIYQDSLIHLSRVLIAAWIIKELGLSVMGIYQVIITFSTIYLTIPIQAMSGYAMPIIAAANSQKEITRSINESLRFLLFLLTPAIAVIMIWPEIFVYLFFSRDFMSAVGPLQIQLLGTVFVLMAFPYGVAFQAKGHLKALLVIATLTPILYLSLVWLFFGIGQLEGIAAAYAVCMFILMIVQHFLARAYFGMRIVPKNLKLILSTAVWIAVAFFAGAVFPHPGFRILASILVIPWFFVSSKKHEREFLTAKWNQIKDLKKVFAKGRLKPLPVNAPREGAQHAARG